ncbi:MAG: hypothetical protein ACEQSL_03780 [Sediminibacterium sp.]
MSKNVDKEKTSKSHHGNLLEKLYAWSGEKTQVDFAKKIGTKGRSRHWYIGAIEWEIIPLKDRYDICRAYNIPIEYWDGKFNLEIPVLTVNESQVKYQTRSGELIEQVTLLKDRIYDKDQLIIELQQEVIRLQRELQK